MLLCFTLSSCVQTTIDYGDLIKAKKVELIYYHAGEIAGYYDYNLIRQLSKEEHYYVANILSSDNKYLSEWEPIPVAEYALLFFLEEYNLIYCNGVVCFLYKNGDFEKYYVGTIKQYAQIMSYLGIREEWFDYYL